MINTTTPTSSINSVYKTIEIKNNKKKAIFNIVVHKCSRCIEKNVSINNLSCFYQVPEFLIGYPLYSLEECIKHVQNELGDSGFVVVYFFPNILYISWNPIDIEKKKKSENEIKTKKKIKKEKHFIESVTKSGGKFVLNL